MKYLVLVNPSANGGRALGKLREYQTMLPDAEYVILKNIEEATERAATAAGFEALLACGGDGTVNAVADGIMKNPDNSLKMGVLYAGTSPDFCMFHKIPLDTRRSVKLLEKGISKEVEIFEIRHNGRFSHFSCSCNLGMGADVAESANRLRPYFGDKAGTFFALLINLFKSKKYNYCINGELIGACNHLLITKMPYIASGLNLKMPPLKENEYVLWFIQNVSWRGWLKIIPKLYRGDACGTFKLYSGLTEVSSGECVKIEYDGDARGELPLEVRISPRKLNLICGE